MAITWGTAQTGGTGGIRLGYETSQSGDTLTVKFYVNTKYSVSDTNNTFVAVVNGSTIYNGAVSIKTSSNSGGWSSTNTVHLATGSTKASGSISFSASLTGINTVGSSLKATVSGSATNWIWTNVTAGSVAIRDNYNNSFTVTCTSGTAGTNNPITAQGMRVAQYKNADGSWMWSNEDRTTLSKTIDLGGLTNSDQRQVAGYLTSYATYGANANVSNTALINQYRPPSNPSDVKLIYTKSRLTIKEKWILSWTAATKTNNTSPIKGYRIRMVVNGECWPIKNSAGVTISSKSGSDYFYDTENTSTSLDIWPGIQRLGDKYIKPGDEVKFNIYAYTKYGAYNDGAQLWSGSGLYPAESPVYPIQNAGVARVKVGGEWKEGVVSVEVDGKWIEADVVQIKADGKWKESE